MFGLLGHSKSLASFSTDSVVFLICKCVKLIAGQNPKYKIPTDRLPTDKTPKDKMPTNYFRCRK